MPFKNSISPNPSCSHNSALTSEYGFYEWYIQEKKIILCPHLAEIIGFKTKSTTQSHDEWIQLTHPDDNDNEKLKLVREKLIKGETLYVTTESRKLCRDGMWRWFSVRGKVIDFDDNGNPVRAVGTCADISGIREIESKLEQTRLLFKENNRIKGCYKKEFPLNELCEEILTSFEKLTNSSNPLLLFSSTNDVKSKKIKFTNTNDPALYNLSKDDSLRLMADLEKFKFVNEMLNSEAHKIQNGEKRYFLGILLDLPLQQKAIIVIERETPFDEELLSLLEPLIGTAAHVIGIKKLQENSSELDNILSFFIQQVPAPVAMFDTNMCYKLDRKSVV